MKYKIIILLTLALFCQAVSADVIIPGTKSVDWCYEISNINDYPDYVLVFHDERAKDYGMINQGDCFSFYKIGLTRIYAIKKAEFNEGELNRDFFEENNSKLIRSNIQLNAFSPVQENDPLQKAAITLDIQSLSENNFEIKKSKITYTYTDGTTEEKVFQSQEVIPDRSKIAILPWWFARFWHIILPIAAIAIIGIIIFIRKK